MLLFAVTIQLHLSEMDTHLDLFNSMHYEHVLQVLHSSLHPVVERGGPLGKLKKQLINGLQQFFCPLGGLHVSNINYVILSPNPAQNP